MQSDHHSNAIFFTWSLSPSAMSAGPPPSLENLVKPDFGSRPIGFLPQCCFLRFFFGGGDLDDRMCWLIWLDE